MPREFESEKISRKYRKHIYIYIRTVCAVLVRSRGMTTLRFSLRKRWSTFARDTSSRSGSFERVIVRENCWKIQCKTFFFFLSLSLFPIFFFLSQSLTTPYIYTPHSFSHIHIYIFHKYTFFFSPQLLASIYFFYSAFFFFFHLILSSYFYL